MNRVFQTAPRRSLRLRLLVTLAPSFGLVGGGLAAFQQWTAGREVLAAGLLVLLAALWRTRHWRPGRMSCGELQLDAGGQAFWRDARSATQSRFMPQQWFSAAGLVWIKGESDGQGHRLVFSQPAMTADDWTAMHRWLVWLDRGGRACKTGGMPPSVARRV